MADGPLGLLNIMAFLSAAAILFIAWQAWTARPRVSGVEERLTTLPPGDLHPAYAGALASGRINDNQIEAAVLELIRNGAIELEPDSDERSKVQVRILDPDRSSDPIEQCLLETLERRASSGLINYQSLTRLRNDWDTVRTVLRREMTGPGWINPSMVQTRLPFTLPGVLGVAFAAALMIAAVTYETGWPVLGALVVGLTGLLVLTAGSVVPQTTRDGERAAVPWRGFRSGLVQARDDAHGTLDLDLVFPYIVAMGMAASFDRYLRRASQSGYIPQWIGRRSRVQEWPEGWHTYWIALHTALAPTDPINTTAPAGSPWRRGITGGR